MIVTVVTDGDVMVPGDVFTISNWNCWSSSISLSSRIEMSKHAESPFATAEPEKNTDSPLPSKIKSSETTAKYAYVSDIKRNFSLGHCKPADCPGTLIINTLMSCVRPPAATPSMTVHTLTTELSSDVVYDDSWNLMFTSAYSVGYTCSLNWADTFM